LSWFQVSSISVVKDVAAIASPILAPAIGAVTAILIHRWRYKEVVNCYIDWGERGYPPEEGPYLVIHNRGDKSVAIRSLDYWFGTFRRVKADQTALDYIDPSDISFRYLVEPNATRWLPVDERMAKRIMAEASRTAKFLVRFRRSRAIVIATTMAGTKLTTSAEYILPWNERPKWIR
jgi:hypothetical protein